MDSGIPTDVLLAASRATKELQTTIEDFNKQSSKQTETMIKLTRIITILTLLLFIGLVVQIWISI